MADMAIELPSRANQTEFNLERWGQILADSFLASLEQRIETDRHGHVIMTPPPGSRHSDLRSELAFKLRELLRDGTTRVEVPISTADGVRAADVAWTALDRIDRIKDPRAYLEAPDICVEVLSPSNTPEEIDDKAALYFNAGAREVWLCGLDGKMSFLFAESPAEEAGRSQLCPAFPARICV